MKVHPASAKDIPRVADALAEAFAGDPPMQWFLPEEEDREERLRPYFRAVIRHLHLRYGEVWVTDGADVGLVHPAVSTA